MYNKIKKSLYQRISFNLNVSNEKSKTLAKAKSSKSWINLFPNSILEISFEVSEIPN